jgi:hypothetical protein
MNPNDWQHYFLLVSFCAGRENYSLLCAYATQEQVFEKMRAYSKYPSHVNATRLNETTFELLERDYRHGGMFIEGEN